MRKTTRVEGICPICKKHKLLEVDHDHATGLIRGRVCQRCNLGLGWLESGWLETHREAIKAFLTHPPGIAEGYTTWRQWTTGQLTHPQDPVTRNPQVPLRARQTKVLVALGDPATSVDAQTLAKVTGVSRKHIHHVLHLLEHRGYVQEVWEPFPLQINGQRHRRVYQITESGFAERKLLAGG